MRCLLTEYLYISIGVLLAMLINVQMCNNNGGIIDNTSGGTGNTFTKNGTIKNSITTLPCGIGRLKNVGGTIVDACT